MALLLVYKYTRRACTWAAPQQKTDHITSNRVPQLQTRSIDRDGGGTEEEEAGGEAQDRRQPRRLAAHHVVAHGQVVLLGVPQRDVHGRRRRAGPPLRHVAAGMGCRDGGGRDVVRDHALHAVAAGADARDGPRQALRPVPRARAARVRRPPGPLDHPSPADHRHGRHRRRVHGHRRAVPAQVPRPRLPGRRRRLHRHAPHVLDHDLRHPALRPLPAPKLQLHLRRLRRRRRHVPRLLHDRLLHVGGQGCQSHGGRHRLRAQGDHDVRAGVRHAQRAGHRVVRVRGAQRGAGNPGHHPVHAGEAVQEAHVARRRRGLRRRRALLLLRRLRRVLRLRQLRGPQRAHHPRQAAVAHRRRQPHGRHPCHRRLPGLRHAHVRHDRDRARQEAQVQPGVLATLRVPLSLCRRYHVHRIDLPLLRRPARILRRLRLRANDVLRKTSIDRACFLILNYTITHSMQLIFFHGLQIPCIMWLMVRKPKKYGLTWFINIVSFGRPTTGFC